MGNRVAGSRIRWPKTILVAAILGSLLIGSYGCIEAVFFIATRASATGTLINYTQIERSRSGLSDAAESWAAKQVSTYTITVVKHSPTFEWLTCGDKDLTLTVSNGKVIKSSKMDANPDCRKFYEQLTVEQVLSRVSKDIGDADPLRDSIIVDFDPEWSFVSKYRYVHYSSESPTNTVYVLEFSNFTPVISP